MVCPPPALPDRVRDATRLQRYSNCSILLPDRCRSQEMEAPELEARLEDGC